MEALLPESAEVVKALVDHHGRFLAFLEQRVESRAAAEDLLQAALAKALERPELAETERPVQWFYRLLRNALVDHYRGRAAHLRALEREAGGEETVDLELERAICACVDGLIDTLKPEYAQIVRAVDLGERPPTEFAREAGITANNAFVRLHRARQALKRRLEQTCGTCTEHGCLDCHCKRP